MKVDFIGKCLLLEEDGERVLVVGDLHLGFEENLNNSGVFIGRGMLNDYVESFDRIFEGIIVDKVVLLGDVKHGFGKGMGQEWDDVKKLIDYLGSKCSEIMIVQGNHDNYLKNIVGRENIEVRDYWVWKGVAFLHGNKDFEEIWKSEIKVWVVGHGHPAVKIGDGTKVEKYKCFLDGKFKKKRVIICPSFFEYNSGSDPRENELGLVWDLKLDKFKVKIVGDDGVVRDFGELGKI